MPQQQQNEGMTWQRSSNLVFWLCLMHQRALTIPMRRKYGVQALAWPCVWALVMMLLWMGFSGDRMMGVWILFWLGCFILRRIEALRLKCTNAPVHSGYDGWPFDAIRFLFSWRNENVAKLIIEPILVGLLAGIVYWIYGNFDWPMYGMPYFLLTGLFTLPAVEVIKQTIWRKKTQDMLDARLEQEYTVRSYREKYGDS